MKQHRAVHQRCMGEVAFVVQIVGKTGMQAFIVAHHPLIQNVKPRKERDHEYQHIQE